MLIVIHRKRYLGIKKNWEITTSFKMHLEKFSVFYYAVKKKKKSSQLCLAQTYWMEHGALFQQLYVEERALGCQFGKYWLKQNKYDLHGIVGILSFNRLTFIVRFNSLKYDLISTELNEYFATNSSNSPVSNTRIYFLNRIQLKIRLAGCLWSYIFTSAR